jgi:hypothetical protein
MSEEEELRAKLAEFHKQLGQVRPVTRNLIESVMLDAWPRDAAIVDFGLDSQKHYEALYYPIRELEIMPAALDEALGHGGKLTELVREARSNPHRDVGFSTSWDVVYGRDTGPPAGGRASYLKSVEARAAASDRGATGDKDRDRES